MSKTDLMNVRQTAAELGVHENTVRNWEEKGLLRGIRLPGSNFRRFPREEIARMRKEMFEQYAPAEVDSGDALTGVKGEPVEGNVL